MNEIEKLPHSNSLATIKEDSDFDHVSTIRCFLHMKEEISQIVQTINILSLSIADVILQDRVTDDNKDVLQDKYKALLNAIEDLDSNVHQVKYLAKNIELEKWRKMPAIKEQLSKLIPSGSHANIMSYRSRRRLAFGCELGREKAPVPGRIKQMLIFQSLGCRPPIITFCQFPITPFIETRSKYKDLTKTAEAIPLRSKFSIDRDILRTSYLRSKLTQNIEKRSEVEIRKEYDTVTQKYPAKFEKPQEAQGKLYANEVNWTDSNEQKLFPSVLDSDLEQSQVFAFDKLQTISLIQHTNTDQTTILPSRNNSVVGHAMLKIDEEIFQSCEDIERATLQKEMSHQLERDLKKTEEKKRNENETEILGVRQTYNQVRDETNFCINKSTNEREASPEIGKLRERNKELCMEMMKKISNLKDFKTEHQSLKNALENVELKVDMASEKAKMLQEFLKVAEDGSQQMVEKVEETYDDLKTVDCQGQGEQLLCDHSSNEGILVRKVEKTKIKSKMHLEGHTATESTTSERKKKNVSVNRNKRLHGGYYVPRAVLMKRIRDLERLNSEVKEENNKLKTNVACWEDIAFRTNDLLDQKVLEIQDLATHLDIWDESRDGKSLSRHEDASKQSFKSDAPWYKHKIGIEALISSSCKQSQIVSPKDGICIHGKKFPARHERANLTALGERTRFCKYGANGYENGPGTNYGEEKREQKNNSFSDKDCLCVHCSYIDRN